MSLCSTGSQHLFLPMDVDYINILETIAQNKVLRSPICKMCKNVRGRREFSITNFLKINYFLCWQEWCSGDVTTDVCNVKPVL
jgi:hypothetical protein